MEEISYWIYTKRAPCLMNYDLNKDADLKAHCSKAVPVIEGSIQSISDDTETPSIQKPKKKLSLLDDKSASVRDQKLYFDTSNQKINYLPIPSSQSESTAHEDFNIKKPKKAKKQAIKNSVSEKKSKMVASTPKSNTNLRRSLRNSSKLHNNSGLNDSSFEMINNCLVNGQSKRKLESTPKVDSEKSGVMCKRSMGKLSGIEVISNNKEISKSNNVNALSKEFENLSDLSGFTARYIRSTKSGFKNGNVQKPNSVLKNNTRKNDKFIVSVNKSINTGAQLHFSSDSSQNCVNLVTKQNSYRPETINRSTSLLKFISPRNSKRKSSKNNATPTEDSILESQPSERRYPKRLSKPRKDYTILSFDLDSPKKRASPKKNRSSVQSPVKTRSSTNVCLSQDTGLDLSNATGLVNVNKINKSGKTKKKKKLRKNVPNRQSTYSRDSLREKSGFSACFSESDDDRPLKAQKFFC